MYSRLIGVSASSSILLLEVFFFIIRWHFYEISPIPHIFRLEMYKEVIIAVAPERPLSAVYDGG